MTVNIYITTYNRANYLSDCIQSVLSQTFTDFTLIILDNCSTDSTEKVVQSFNDSRIKYIRHNQNIGGLGNINFAITSCEADFFVVFHDDDIMCNNMLEDELKEITKSNEIIAVSGNALVFSDSEEVVAKKRKTDFYMAENKYFERYMLSGKTFIFPSIMYRTSYMKKHNIILDKDVGPCADVVLCFMIEKYGGIIREIPEVVMKYRHHGGQDSVRNLYPMNIRLFHYLKNSNEFYDDYKRNIVGRNRRYKHLCKMIYLDWINGCVSEGLAEQYIKSLSCELCCRESNIWTSLYSMSRNNPIVSKLLRFAYMAKKKRHI